MDDVPAPLQFRPGRIPLYIVGTWWGLSIVLLQIEPTNEEMGGGGGETVDAVEMVPLPTIGCIRPPGGPAWVCEHYPSKRRCNYHPTPLLSTLSACLSAGPPIILRISLGLLLPIIQNQVSGVVTYNNIQDQWTCSHIPSTTKWQCHQITEFEIKIDFLRNFCIFFGDIALWYCTNMENIEFGS